MTTLMHNMQQFTWRWSIFISNHGSPSNSYFYAAFDDNIAYTNSITDSKLSCFLHLERSIFLTVMILVYSAAV